MAGSVNKVILVGNVVRDPEARTMTSGERVATFTLATSESWRDKATGEKKEKSEFHRIAVFNENLVRITEAYVKKGSSLYVEGSLQTRKWTDNAGVEKYSTEIVLQKFRGEITLLGGRPDQNDDANPRRGGGGGEGFDTASVDLDDSIPF